MPLPQYEIIIRSATGEKRAHLVGTAAGNAHAGFLRLSAALRVNAAGLLDFDLRADNASIADLEEDGQIELWRNKALLLRALYIDPNYAVDDKDREYFTATCVGEMDLLDRAIIAWPSETLNLTKFTSMRAESVLHTLVKYNATSEATTANGRLLDFPSPRIEVEADLGRGDFVTFTDLSGKPLLTALQEVALKGGVDFDLIKTGDQAWVFRVFAGQRGTDRTSSVVFHRAQHNMGQLTYDGGRSESKTAVVVGGQGEGDKRQFVVRYGPDYTATNHRELFHSFSGDVGGVVAMQAEGDRVMEERRIKPTLSFTPLQASGTRFGVDYTLGDLVRAKYREVNATYQVVGVSLSYDNAKETVSVEMKQR